MAETITADIESTECFTALTFESNGIHDIGFNSSGTDTLLWAANGVDYFAGYHQHNRAVFTVEWSTGKASFGKILNVTDASSDDTSAASYPWATMVTKPLLFLFMLKSIMNL
jgi:hypothetical protein